MKPVGLIEDEWIFSYAAGALSEAHALVVASHIDYHPDLQQRVRDAEDIGGALLETGAPSTVNESMFDDIMSVIDAANDSDAIGNSAASLAAVTSDTASDLPAPLAQYLGAGRQDLSKLPWRIMGPGLSQHQLATGPDGEKLWLLRAKAGAKVPVHDHSGTEFTLILKGSYIAGGKTYTRGMMEIADADTVNHEPMIGEEEDCICLVVTEAPIKLHSFLGRLVQPFIGL